jgi:hypothetical protein
MKTISIYCHLPLFTTQPIYWKQPISPTNINKEQEEVPRTYKFIVDLMQLSDIRHDIYTSCLTLDIKFPNQDWEIYIPSVVCAIKSNIFFVFVDTHLTNLELLHCYIQMKQDVKNRKCFVYYQRLKSWKIYRSNNESSSFLGNVSILKFMNQKLTESDKIGILYFPQNYTIQPNSRLIELFDELKNAYL